MLPAEAVVASSAIPKVVAGFVSAPASELLLLLLSFLSSITNKILTGCDT